MVASQQEKKSRQTAMFVSITLHVALLLLFFFLMAWRAPDPPLPEYGIELNFGVDDAGSGNVQTTSPASNAPVAEARPDPPASQPQPVETEPEPEPEIIPDETIDDVPVVKPAETPSPVVVKKEQPKKQPEKPVEKPKEKQPEKKPEAKPVEKTPEKPKVNNDALMTSKTDGGGGKTGTGDKPSGNNNGDKPGTVGDQGNPQGKLDAKALYGTPGGGGGTGASYSMRGWMWDSKPTVVDNSTESGRIVFQVKIDDEGQIMSVTTVEKTVSPVVEALYKREVEKLTFSPTSENSVPAPTSTGTITFILRTR